MQRKMVYGLIILGISFMGAGCGSKETKSEETARVPVEVTVVQTGRVLQSLSFNGDVEAELEVKVFSKIPDRIEKYYVDEGSYVQRGAPIARIFATTIQQGVRQAEAGLARGSRGGRAARRHARRTGEAAHRRTVPSRTRRFRPASFQCTSTTTRIARESRIAGLPGPIAVSSMLAQASGIIATRRLCHAAAPAFARESTWYVVAAPSRPNRSYVPARLSPSISSSAAPR